MRDIIGDLDLIIDRIVRNDAVLILEQESRDWWTVTDAANQDDVMMRADRELCIRFMRAFVVRHPEASIGLPERAAVTSPPAARSESPTEHSWCVAQQADSALSERGVSVAGSPRSESAPPPPPPTPNVGLPEVGRVLPFRPRMLAQTDEASA